MGALIPFAPSTAVQTTSNEPLAFDPTPGTSPGPNDFDGVWPPDSAYIAPGTQTSVLVTLNVQNEQTKTLRSHTYVVIINISTGGFKQVIPKEIHSPANSAGEFTPWAGVTSFPLWSTYLQAPGQYKLRIQCNGPNPTAGSPCSWFLTGLKLADNGGVT